MPITLSATPKHEWFELQAQRFSSKFSVASGLQLDPCWQFRSLARSNNALLYVRKNAALCCDVPGAKRTIFSPIL